MHAQHLADVSQICHLRVIQITEESYETFEWSMLTSIDCFSRYVVPQTPVVASTASHLNANWTTVSFQKLLFVFILTPNASWTFIRPHGALSREGEDWFLKPFKLTILLAPLLKQASSPWVSLSQPPRRHHLCSVPPSICYCVRPLKRIKVFLSFFVWENAGFFANLTWGHFCLWPSEPTMNLVDLLHPRELIHVCVGYLTPHYLSNSARLFFSLLVIWTILQGLNACLGVSWREHANTLQPFPRHCTFSFRVSVFDFV